MGVGGGLCFLCVLVRLGFLDLPLLPLVVAGWHIYFPTAMVVFVWLVERVLVLWGHVWLLFLPSTSVPFLVFVYVLQLLWGRSVWHKCVVLCIFLCSSSVCWVLLGFVCE